VEPSLIVPFMAIAVAGALWLVLYFAYGREYEEPNPPEYAAEPPQDWKPIEVAFLWRWGEINATDFTATVMDLVQRGALKLDIRREPRPRLGGLLRDELIEVCHLQWVKAPPQPLSPCEQYLIRELVFAGRAPGDEMTLDRFRELVERNQGAMARRFEHWVALAKAEAERIPITDPNSQWAMWAGAAIGGLLFIGSFRLTADYQLAGLLPGAAGIGMVFGSTAIRRRNPEAAKALHQWQAFQRYLRDFSDLKEYSAPAVQVWDRYLVYAITLGVADRVTTQFEGLYPGPVPEGPTQAQIEAASTAGLARLLAATRAAVSSLGERAAATDTSGGSGASGGVASSVGGGEAPEEGKAEAVGEPTDL
jgi:hypothetical protein